MDVVNLGTVFVAATLTAVCTGLGVLPFLLVKEISERWLGIFNGLAAGLMLGASQQLAFEGFQLGPYRTVIGLLLGLLLIVIANRSIREYDGINLQGLVNVDTKKALLILGVMTAHSFAEGIGVGVSFGDSEELGIFVAAAIAVHNIPEGLAISLVLIPRGMGLLRAAGWSVFTSLPQPLMAVPAYLFILVFTPLLPVGLGLAAGAMIWMIFSELIPDAVKHTEHSIVATATTLAFIAMMAFQLFVLK